MDWNCLGIAVGYLLFLFPSLFLILVWLLKWNSFHNPSPTLFFHNHSDFQLDSLWGYSKYTFHFIIISYRKKKNSNNTCPISSFSSTSFFALFPSLSQEANWILVMAGEGAGGGNWHWEGRRGRMRAELKSHSSSNIPLSKTPALVVCCRYLLVWLYGIRKCSLAKESFEKAPAVSGGCCPIAQSVN